MMLSMPKSGSSADGSSSSHHGGGKTKSPILEWECEWEDVLNVQLKRSRCGRGGARCIGRKRGEGGGGGGFPLLSVPCSPPAATL